MACTHILLSLDVVVHDLHEVTRPLRDLLDNRPESDPSESCCTQQRQARVRSELTIRDSAGVDGTHAKLGAPCRIAFDSQLHRKAAIEGQREHFIEWHELSHTRQGGVLPKRVSSKGCFGNDEALSAHVFERCLFQQRQSRLSELRRH